MMLIIIWLKDRMRLGSSTRSGSVMRPPTKRRLRLRIGSSGRVIAALLGGLMVGCATPVSAATSHPSAPAFMVTRDCQEEQAFVDGDASAVARQLPHRYSAVRDPFSDAPVLFFRGERCGAVTVDGATAPATMASFGVLIQTPDGTGCASAAPAVGSNRGDVPPV